MTFDFINNQASLDRSSHKHHDTTNFFYRPQSSIPMTDIDDSVTLHKRRCRTNLRNAELSKRTFRIFLEKQILSHVEVEIQKNNHEAQTPLTSNFDYNKSDFTLSHARLTLSPLQTTISGKMSIKNELNLPNLETEVHSSNKAIRISNTVITADSEINVYEDSVQNKSKVCTYTASTSNQNDSTSPKINRIVNKESHTLIYNTSPEWFQDNEIVSVHGSLLSETISDISSHSIDLQRNIHHKQCRWKRILFCCIN
ncbi:uncharacterized protein [Anoplolepis gracilipes]|uniref:uncharacterized protein n=1 Tax=Anoplolepis gracilipes TaxID=354296 RepID=UPI003BA0F30C